MEYQKQMLGGINVGKGIKKGLQWAGRQVQKEMELDDAKQKKYKAQGKALNSSYSGRK